MPLIAELRSEALALVPLGAFDRVVVDAETWRRAVLGVASGKADLAALWAEPGVVHMAVAAAPLADADVGAVGPASDGPALLVLSLAAEGGRFPSVGVTHPAALRPERAIRDLYGLVPDGCPDARGWLDHGRWGLRAPLGAATPDAAAGDTYPFLPAEGPPMHQIPVGPVHAGIIEPGHFRFTANGEIVVRLEERLGYVHKGIEGLLAGAPLDRAARLAGRVSGDSTVAYAIAFARAVEAAAGVAVPERAHWLRGVMAELERLANHLGDVGAICNDAAFALMLAHCGMLREKVLRAADTAFGHRLMMDRVVPGGVATDLTAAGRSAILDLVATIERDFPPLARLYDNSTSLLDRTVSTGRLSGRLASMFGAGGPVGRASGRRVDARARPGYPPYDRIDVAIARLEGGDVDARIRLRMEEITISLGLVRALLDRLPDGPIAVAVPARAGEGLAVAEGFRGDVLAWVRLDGAGTVARAHLRDPSVFQWPLLEAAIDGNIVADFPLINKSFNGSYSGHDL
jgi:Ni,Fe-hydrogenase III large subunit